MDRWVIASCLLPVLASVAAAQGSHPVPPLSARPGLHAVRATSAITIDGALSEPAWQAAQACTTFTQRDPVEGAAPSQRTEVRILFDKDALYVGARMYDTATDSIVTELSRRDGGTRS